MNAARIALAVMIGLAVALSAAAPATASCGLMQKLAQRHADDMARRERLDHAGFGKRAAQGARAENVAMGHASEAATLAQWRASSRHAANMRLPGCKAVARAQSRSGRYYWALVIGK